MRLRWPAFLTRFTALSASKYNRRLHLSFCSSGDQTAL